MIDPHEELALPTILMWTNLPHQHKYYLFRKVGTLYVPGSNQNIQVVLQRATLDLPSEEFRSFIGFYDYACGDPRVLFKTQTGESLFDADRTGMHTAVNPCHPQLNPL